MKRFIKLFVCALTILSTLSLCACSAFSSSWKIVRKQSEGGENLEYYAVLNLSGSQKINSVWINVEGLVEENSELKLYFGSSATEENDVNSRLQKVTINKEATKKAKGWVRITKDFDYSYAYLKIVTDCTMNIGEIFVIGDNSNVLEVDLYYCGHKAPNNSSKKEFTKTQLVYEEIEDSALCLVDEQDDFDLEEVTKLYEEVQKQYVEE